MTIGSILLGLALLLVVGLIIARPLLKPQPRPKSRLTERQALLTQKEAVLTQISNLDFDHETGKVPETDYKQQRAQFMAEATDILRQLDILEGGVSGDGAPAKPQVASPARDTEADVEAAIARLRSKPAKEKPAKAEAATSNGKTKYCPQCGQPTDPDDKFCASCGHELLQPQHA